MAGASGGVPAPLLGAGRLERGGRARAPPRGACPEAARPAAGQDRGLMVMQVAAEGPAGKAGVLAGDILIAVDGMPASHPGAIARQFGPESVGKQVELRLLRSGAARTLSATITARPAG